MILLELVSVTSCLLPTVFCIQWAPLIIPRLLSKFWQNVGTIRGYLLLLRNRVRSCLFLLSCWQCCLKVLKAISNMTRWRLLVLKLTLESYTCRRSQPLTWRTKVPYFIQLDAFHDDLYKFIPRWVANARKGRFVMWRPFGNFRLWDNFPKSQAKWIYIRLRIAKNMNR